jgi:ABC-2 type transport system ATP-binding protein
VIEVENLSKRFGKTQAVSGLSFRVEPGTITGFLGPNGAGKSTTLRSVLGLVHPDAGRTMVLGVPYAQLDEPLHRVGAVLEASEVHPGRNGRNHLRVLAAAAGVPRSRVEEVLALVELSTAAKRRVKGYSMGMRQRLGLASALLGDPEVLVLDEPANGLDPAGIRWLRDFLRSLAAEGRTILVSSHVLAEVAQTADRVVIIHRGKLVQQAPIAEILAGARGDTFVRSPDAERLMKILADNGGNVLGDGTELVVGLPPERVGELAAANGIVLHELRVQQATLEEVFLELTGGETTQAEGSE